MRHIRTGRRAAAVLLACSLAAAAAVAQVAPPPSPDHFEPHAWLDAPFTGSAGEARNFTLSFQHPDARVPSGVLWMLDLVDADGRIVRSWDGQDRMFRDLTDVVVPWDGRDAAGKALPAGFYTARLVVRAGDPLLLKALADPARARHAQWFGRLHLIEQRFDVQVGNPPKPKLLPFDALPVGAAGEAAAKAAGATGGLPYTVYFGNLHSQTNDSDGGGAIGSCASSQPAQTGAFGPADAYAYARGRGLDFLLTSEHNHYFDGSSSTNTSANPTTARNRYAAGRGAAASFNTANPGFLALYGMEWGVISNGGHLNIINGDVLANWEYNASGQLIGDVFTEKSNYPAIYATMRGRGWIGQFNHPSTSTTENQFAAGGQVLGYNADGYEVMVATEILNSSAFSTNTTETETGRSSYESAFRVLLERGYRVAPTSNQDNHCANWGASYTNRTGVLIPTGTALSNASFTDALRARRVFATEEKTSQVILTANGRIMGERFASSGNLNLQVLYASSAGDTVSKIEIFGGVPGRNGSPSLVASAASATVTPATGANYYYAKITQADGKLLWSAPVWVDQGTAADTTPPTVSASVAGSSGTITLNATASDNVGVTQVEFLVDGVARGTDTSAPYSLAFDSRTLTNGSHTLVARARDAAGNTGSSSTISFSISNPVADTTPPTVSASVTGSSGTITLNATASDNVGVTQVEFLVDGVARGTDTSAPYSLAFDSRTLANGSHTLVARARDAAGNFGSSSSVSFSISNTTATELVRNPGFESGSTNWTATSGVITNDSGFAARTGTWKAWMLGYGSARTDTLYQTITIPSTATTATLRFWLAVSTEETGTTAFDTMSVQVRSTANSVLRTLATYSNVNAGGYAQRSFDLSAYRGQTIRIYWTATEGSRLATSFVIDDVSVLAQ